MIGKVLVIGDDTRSFLAIVRSLGRHGVAVHAAPFDFTAPALASRHLSAVHRLPYHLGDGGEWLAAMEALLQAQYFDLVIPCDERGLIPLSRHRARLEALARLAIPADRAADVLFDKHLTRELAASLRIARPSGWLVEAGASAEAIVAEVGLPVVIKPRRSFEADTLYRRGRVRIVHDSAALARLLAAGLARDCLFEGFVAGDGVGVSVLAHRGRVLQTFQHRRLREIAGAGFYRVSEAPSPPLVRACEAICDALAYTGVAMFEFKVHPRCGDWALLEVNARPWGSLPLALACGVDFPWRWYRLLTAGEEIPPQPYPAGRYGRNLLPDLRQMLARPPGVIGLCAEMLRLAAGRERHDVLVSDDPRPAWEEVRQELAARFRRPRRQADRALARLALCNQSPGSGVAFVCQGNVCRSPFAAAVLGRLRPDLIVMSAGMLPRQGFAPPAEAIAAAEALSIDLSAHRSRHFGEAEMAKAALVVVFDDKNADSLRRRFPKPPVPVVRLGSFLDGGEHDIADPDGGDRATFDRTYARILAAVKALASF
jgi:protein-tyrosine-phosphatase/predicted ATP-grasp superfamily ATP-dependent carboligase